MQKIFFPDVLFSRVASYTQKEVEKFFQYEANNPKNIPLQEVWREWSYSLMNDFYEARSLGINYTNPSRTEMQRVRLAALSIVRFLLQESRDLASKLPYAS